MSTVSVGLKPASATFMPRGSSSVLPWRRTRRMWPGRARTRRPTECTAAAAATSSMVCSVSTGTSCRTKSPSKLEVNGKSAIFKSPRVERAPAPRGPGAA